MDDAKLIDRAVQDPIALRLLFISLHGRSAESQFVQADSLSDPALKVKRVAEAVERHRLMNVPGSGLLAAAAYSQGQFDLAERFADREDSATSRFVKAKLALRTGDRQTALAEYKRR